MSKFRNSLGEEVTYTNEELQKFYDEMLDSDTFTIPNDPDNPKYYYMVEE